MNDHSRWAGNLKSVPVPKEFSCIQCGYRKSLVMALAKGLFTGLLKGTNWIRKQFKL